MVLGMISAGEASDTVPKMMDKLSDIFDKEVDNAIKSMTQKLGANYDYSNGCSYIYNHGGDYDTNV